MNEKDQKKLRIFRYAAFMLEDFQLRFFFQIAFKFMQYNGSINSKKRKTKQIISSNISLFLVLAMQSAWLIYCDISND